MQKHRLFNRPARRLSFVAACLAIVLTAAACGSTGSPSASSGGSSSNDYLAFSPCCSWGTTWSYNAYNADGLGIADNLINLPLAVQNYPSLTSFTPELAKTWSVGGDSLTVHLRPGVKWQNGQPVTSKDVYDTVLLDGTNGSVFWNDITNVSTPNSSTVVFTLRNGESPVLAEDDLFGNLYVYPSSVYGKFVTPSLKSDEVAYFREDATDPNAASKMPQYKAMGSLFQRLAAAPVNTLIGDGPFKLEGITTSEAKLAKWGGYWDASQVHVPGIDYYNDQNSAIYPQLFSGTAQFSNVYLPPAIIKKWESTPDSHTALPLAFGFVLEFNNAKYPLNETKVRQALAYVINRQTITDAAYGTSVNRGGSPSVTPDGLPPTIQSLYLTKSQIASLNTYATNQAKATSLLESAGFHKRNGQWIMPNGKPFTLSLVANTATSDIVESFDSAATELSAFGIHSSVSAVEGAEVTTDQYDGSFDAISVFDGSYNPLSIYNTMLGTGNNFLTLGNYAGKRGMGFGPVENVPGLGRVDVPSTITHEQSSVAPGPQMDKLVYDWARLVDQQVPYLWYATKVYQFSYSTKDFTDWPPLNAQHTSPVWNIVSANMEAGLLVALNDGYIRPAG